ncbi:MAG: flagellar biosynthesis protein FlhB [Bacteroidales bacterium]|nr:flagellar biosynthesis protein FlhB [Ruminococcus flavefaciens]MCM1268472.1 flagellar biosynthesis protein FlhB [Bacteroidales bacterium]MCM1415612.1 flagellar biosynthesis protein FlhB [bacterium]MCM1423005.1 flagellar biosynthesis protein FlhB [bacterium]
MSLTYDLQFFAKDGPGGEKTEEPTTKKLEDARKEGQVAKSKEVSTAFEMLAAFILFRIWVEHIGINLVGNIKDLYTQIPEYAKLYDGHIQSATFYTLFVKSLINILLTILPFLLVGFLVAFIANLLQVKWKITGKPLQPKFNKLNPVNGIKRLFSLNSLVELIKSLLKIALIGYVVYDYLRKNMPPILQLYDISLNQGIALVGTLVINLGIRISIFYMLIAAADFVYQKVKFKNDMKMTKQEVKDEYKNQEGDPQIKGKQRQRMMESSRRRMMQQLPEADVVITNPTHFAVAIKYEPEVYDAPFVVAKGADYLAQKIKDVAKENHIEIVENKPLARMLYANVDVGSVVPPELYQAVAEVLAFVYHLQGKV